MTFFGFMHGERIGIGESPAVAVELPRGGGDLRRLRASSSPSLSRGPWKSIAEPHGEEVVRV